ncbi:MAG: hypothetical protein JRI59_01620 [Deltaproteobacteria bacterium]|nr:hypothetical protein [Deltaproteobacteria bacterium]
MPLYRLFRFLLAGILGAGVILGASPAWSHPRLHGLLGRQARSGGQTHLKPEFHQDKTTLFRLTPLATQAVVPTKVTPLLSWLKAVNSCPTAAQTAAALVRLAEQAEVQGRIDLARKVYTLAAVLDPDPTAADRARFRRWVLDFYLALAGPDPCLAFRNFLQKLAGLSSPPSAVRLEEPLVNGWLALERLAGSPAEAPADWAEKALVFWEMQPPAVRPPEGALVVGRLLQGQGLYSEAGRLLTLALKQGGPQVRTRALVALLQLAWASQGPRGLIEALQHWHKARPRELLQALQTWPLNLASPEDTLSPLPEPIILTLREVFPKNSSSLDCGDLWSPAGAAVWEALLSQPLPASLTEYILQKAAHRCWSQGNFALAGRLYRTLLALPGSHEASLFYWDRLGVSHLKQQQPELAEDVFHTLEKEPGGLWPLVARTRQFDLELSRLLTESAW